MANENLRSRHAFGSLEALDAAIADKKVDAYDILFLTDADGHRIGWIDKNGNKVILDMGVSEDVVNSKLEEAIAEANAYADEKLETAIEEKVSESVETKVYETINTVLEAYTAEKFEITDVPEGTLVNYYDNEIRIMCPTDAVWNKQNVGTGGDPNCYYATFRTYFTNDDVAGYREHLGNQSDAEILKDIKVDENGRRYQTTWLALARYDESTDTWTYYGASSSEKRYIGWDYQIDQYNAEDRMIATDCIRINLSNEECHFSIVPFYVNDTIDNVIEETNNYIDQKIAEISIGYEIVEF